MRQYIAKYNLAGIVPSLARLDCVNSTEFRPRDPSLDIGGAPLLIMSPLSIPFKTTYSSNKEIQSKISIDRFHQDYSQIPITISSGLGAQSASGSKVSSCVREATCTNPSNSL